MDLKDLWSRVVMRHLLVIFTMLLLGLASVVLLVGRGQATYYATARIQAATQQPSSDVEAAALESQVQGIAGSPSVTGPALADTHTTGDPTNLAAKHVTVTRLGSSSLVDITVTEPTPQAVVPLANAIAAHTVSFLNDAGQQQAQAALNDIDSTTSVLTKSRDELLTQLSATNDASKTSALVTQLSGIEQQLVGLTTSRGQLLTSVHSATAQLIDEALTTHQTSRHLVTDLVLGIIGSLAIGLLIAAVRETVEPTVPNGRVVAEMVGAPLLGTAVVRGDVSGTALLGLAVAQSARRLDVRSIRVIGPGPTAALEDIATTIRDAVAGGEDLPVSVLRADHGLTVPDGSGALLVVPRGVRLSALRPHEDLLGALGWPLIGVIELPSGRRARRAARAVTASGPHSPSSARPASDQLVVPARAERPAPVERPVPVEQPVTADVHSEGHEANGHEANGHEANGHEANGHEANGHEANGHEANGHEVVTLDAPRSAPVAPLAERAAAPSPLGCPPAFAPTGHSFLPTPCSAANTAPSPTPAAAGA